MALRTAVLSLLVLVTCASTAFAQETTTLTDSQQAYNEQAVALVGEGEYEQAVQKFRSSLAIGEANVTWLNLGRTYQRMGDCRAARDAYARVESAPAVVAPTPEEIATVLERYRSELPDPCPEVPTDAPPEEPAEKAAEETSSSTPELRADTAEADPPRTNWPAIGIGIAGGGVATLVAAYVVNQALLAPRVEELENTRTGGDPDAHAEALRQARSAQTINQVLLFSGAALTATGLGIFTVATLTGGPEVAVAPSAHGATLVLRGRW